MQSYEEIRLANLNRLIEEAGDQATFCDKWNVSQSQVSQWQNGYRKIGDKAARNIERQIGLAPFALDTPEDVMDHIKIALGRADWLSEKQRDSAIDLLASMREADTK